MSTDIFVVTMYRHGSREKHSYVLGAWLSERRAKREAKKEQEVRANLYMPEILSVNPKFNGDENLHINEVVLPLQEVVL
jgi:hypothetical protein